MSRTEYVTPPTWAEIRAWWLGIPTAGPSEKVDREAALNEWGYRAGIHPNATGDLTIGAIARAEVAARPGNALALLCTVQESIAVAVKPIATPMIDDDGELVISMGGRHYPPESFYVIDTSERWIETAGSEFNLDEKTLTPSYDETADYHGLSYFIQAGEQMIAVSLPDGWSE